MTITQNLCPRCGGLMRPVTDVWSQVFESCLMCGYEDYQAEPPKKEAQSPIHYARYAGQTSGVDDVIEVRVVVDRMRSVVYRPSCPFCGADMNQTSLSGKRREMLEERFVCEIGHRISLVPSEDGTRVEWR